MYKNNPPLSRLVSYYVVSVEESSHREAGYVACHTHYVLVMVTALPLQPRLLHKHGSYLPSAPLPPSSTPSLCFCLYFTFFIMFSVRTLLFFFPLPSPPFYFILREHWWTVKTGNKNYDMLKASSAFLAPYLPSSLRLCCLVFGACSKSFPPQY